MAIPPCSMLGHVPELPLLYIFFYFFLKNKTKEKKRKKKERGICFLDFFLSRWSSHLSISFSPYRSHSLSPLHHRSHSLSISPPHHRSQPLTLSDSLSEPIWFEVSRFYFVFLFLESRIFVWWLDLLDKLYFMFLLVKLFWILILLSCFDC
jgi:hypothetical protein